MKSYLVNKRLSFNAYSMIDYLFYLGDSFSSGEIEKPVIVCNKVLENEDDCHSLIQAIEEIPATVGSKVSAEQYSFLELVAQEREFIRYKTCLKTYMPKKVAALCF